MLDTTITVNTRETTGKGANRRLRQEGRIPAVVYGAGLDSVAIDVEERTVQKLLREAGDNAVFLLQREGGGGSRNAMVRDIQYEPHTDKLVHIDFLRVKMDEVVQVSVPLEAEGVATGVKNDGGILDQVHHELEVECLPNLIPQSLSIDVSGLSIGDTLDTSDLDLPEGVELLEEEPRTIFAVNLPRIEEEPEEEEEELLEQEGELPERVGEEEDEESDEEEKSDQD